MCVGRMSITRIPRRRSSASAARSNAVGPAAARSDAVRPAFRMVAAGFGPGPVVPYFGAFWEPTSGCIPPRRPAGTALFSAVSTPPGWPWSWPPGWHSVCLTAFRECVATTESTTVRGRSPGPRAPGGRGGAGPAVVSRSGWVGSFLLPAAEQPAFLVAKAVSEIHERLEGEEAHATRPTPPGVGRDIRDVR